jgi:hypothetical protein
MDKKMQDGELVEAGQHLGDFHLLGELLPAGCFIACAIFLLGRPTRLVKDKLLLGLWDEYCVCFLR